MKTTGLGIRPYEQGLSDLGAGSWAYLQPDGSWGWSNAGLITDGEGALLVDTLYDRPLTERMLRTMRASVPAAEHIEQLVNTHANGDHCNGNCCLPEAKSLPRRPAPRKWPTKIQPPWPPWPRPPGQVSLGISATSSSTVLAPSISRAWSSAYRRKP